MNTLYQKTRASLIAIMLGGAWRNPLPALKISTEELAEISPLLLGSGAGALGWWRICESDLKESATALELLQAYRFHTIHATLHHHRIKQAFSLFRAAGIEPILIKGWANARLYPETGLRPYSDVDLCVRPDQFAAAEEITKNAAGAECHIDLHKALGRLDDRSWDEFYTRSQLVGFGDVKLRILSPEDHIHILSVHMLEDGAWRPILLCDIAAAVEAASTSFDWNLCLGKNKRRAKWVASSIGLAHQLLGAHVEHCPPEIRDVKLPGWLVPTVLRQWETPCINDHNPPAMIKTSLRHPTRLPKALLWRWPDPIGATVKVKGSFNKLPRLPYQMSAYFIHIAKFLGRLPRLLQDHR
jgi:hypothetical protein